MASWHETAPDHAGAVTLEQITFAYAERVIFRDVDLSVAGGEMVGLLGPNGAGKSTLLRVASGLLRPQSGRVAIGATDVRDLSRTELARRVAVVPQDFSVQFGYTVRQLVELGRMPHTGAWGIMRAPDRAAVVDALAATRLTDLADRVFNELSGGERQRVLIAMALAQGSGIVLLDEPTAHLDIRHQVEVLEMLRALNQERGLTVIAALHDLNLAARYFPRLVLFQYGIVQDGPPTAVLNAKLLRTVYGIPVQIGILRGEEFLSVLPPGRDTARMADADTPGLTIHVVAGGGAGELAMRALADAGISFTAGALNVGDSDHDLAHRLAMHCISERPYAAISPASLAETRDTMLASNTVLLCPVPYGPGNVALLDLALDAAHAGRQVLLLEPHLTGDESAGLDEVLDIVRQRDFTAGQALAAYSKLANAGARIVRDPTEVVRILEKRQVPSSPDTSEH